MTTIASCAMEWWVICAGLPPILAAESARRLIPVHVRPSMKEMEASFKEAKNNASAEVKTEGAPANA